MLAFELFLLILFSYLAYELFYNIPLDSEKPSDSEHFMIPKKFTNCGYGHKIPQLKQLFLCRITPYCLIKTNICNGCYSPTNE